MDGWNGWMEIEQTVGRDCLFGSCVDGRMGWREGGKEGEMEV